MAHERLWILIWGVRMWWKDAFERGFTPEVAIVGTGSMGEAVRRTHNWVFPEKIQSSVHGKQ